MDSFKANFGGKEYALPIFRNVNPFESIESYIEEWVLPIMRELPEISFLRCAISGVPTAVNTLDEIKDCVAAGIRNLKMKRFNDLLLAYPLNDFRDALENLVDDISIQMILSWRRSPSLTFAKDASVTAVVSQHKQLTILLNMFLFLSPMTKKTHDDVVEETILVRRRIAAIADSVIARFDTEPAMKELLHLLVEFDAKYRILKFRPLRREKEELADTNFASLDPVALCAFVRKIIDWRDDPDHNQSLYVGERTWTQEAYRALNDEMGRREKFSNIIEQPMVMVAGELVKPPKNEIEAATQAAKNNRNAILKMFFGKM